MKTFTVRVTEEIIKEGVRCNPIECPIAIAISRSINRKVCCGAYIWWPKNHKKIAGRYPDFSLPADVSAWIDRFDFQGTAKPFEFNIEVPDEVLNA